MDDGGRMIHLGRTQCSNERVVLERRWVVGEVLAWLGRERVAVGEAVGGGGDACVDAAGGPSAC
jgi:hypothetical protein